MEIKGDPKNGIPGMSYEERKRRRDAKLAPFDRYWKGAEAVVIHEW